MKSYSWLFTAFILAIGAIGVPVSVTAGTSQYDKDKESCISLGRSYYTLAEMRNKYSEIDLFNSALQSTDPANPESTVALLVMIHTVYSFPDATPAQFQTLAVEKCMKSHGYTGAKT